MKWSWTGVGPRACIFERVCEDCRGKAVHTWLWHANQFPAWAEFFPCQKDNGMTLFTQCNHSWIQQTNADTMIELDKNMQDGHHLSRVERCLKVL